MKVVAELFTSMCGVVTFMCTMVMFPVDGAEVLIYMTSSGDVTSVVLLVRCDCDVSIVKVDLGVVIVVLLICGVASIDMVLLICSLD